MQYEVSRAKNYFGRKLRRWPRIGQKSEGRSQGYNMAMRAVNTVNKEMIDSCLGLLSELAKLPVKHAWVDYDEGADVLYLSFRKPRRAKKLLSDDKCHKDLCLKAREKAVAAFNVETTAKQYAELYREALG